MPSVTGRGSISFSAKSSAFGSPCGRLIRCQARGIVFSSGPRIGAAVGARKARRRRGRRRRASISLRHAGGWAATAGSAIGALEAAIEDPVAHLALALALEQRTAAAFVAPALLRLLGRAIEHHLVALDAVDIGAAQRMMNAAALRVRLGEDQPVAGGAVDGPDMLAVVADHFHMLADLAEDAALLLPALAPPAELAFEPSLVLAPIFVIVAVE